MADPYHQDDQVTLYHGDALGVARTLPDGAADCIVTSPPYFGLRDYGIDGQYGLEASPPEYVETMRGLFSELRRVLADDGTLWLNIGDSYQSSGGHTGQGGNSQRKGRSNVAAQNAAKVVSGLPEKNLLGIPWRVAFALQDDGWILRNAIIWNKPNAMPESVTDRLSGRYEMVFMLSKSRKYWFDLDPIREPHTTAETHAKHSEDWRNRPTRSSDRVGAGVSYNMGFTPAGRNPGDVWNINTQPFSAAHFAVMPAQLAQRCIVAGCKPGGTVLDPFSGSGTTGLAAQRLGRNYVGIDLNAEYLDLSLQTRLAQSALDFNEGLTADA
jgi:DNA modification methylase